MRWHRAALLVLLTLCLPRPSHPGEIISLDLQFEAYRQRTHGFPQHCLSYMVLRNREKTRPLYFTGRVSGGTLAFKFERFAEDSGLAAFDKYTKGDGTVEFRPSCTPLLDRDTYTAAPWLSTEKTPTVGVGFLNVRNVQIDDSDLDDFFRAIQARIAAVKKAKGEAQKGEKLNLPPVRIALKATADIELNVGDRSARAPKSAVTMDLSIGDFWRIDLMASFDVKGADFGFSGADAGPMTGHLHAGAFAPVPEHFRPINVQKATKKELEDLDVDDLF